MKRWLAIAWLAMLCYSALWGMCYLVWYLSWGLYGYPMHWAMEWTGYGALGFLLVGAVKEQFGSLFAGAKLVARMIERRRK